MYQNRNLVRELRIFTYVNNCEKQLYESTVERLQRLRVTKDRSALLRDLAMTFCYAVEQLSDKELINRFSKNKLISDNDFTHLLH